MNAKFIGAVPAPFIIVIAIVILLAGGGTAALITTNTQNPTPAQKENIQTEPTTSTNNQLQLATFYLDEYNEPLAENNSVEACSRNIARLDAMIEQIDADLSLVDQLQASL